MMMTTAEAAALYRELHAAGVRFAHRTEAGRVTGWRVIGGDPASQTRAAAALAEPEFVGMVARPPDGLLPRPSELAPVWMVD